MTFNDFQHLLVTFECPIELFYFMPWNNNVIVTADKHNCYTFWYFFEKFDIVLIEKRKLQSVFYFFLQKVCKDVDNHLRQTCLLVYDSLNNCLQKSKRTVQDHFVHYFLIPDTKSNCGYCSHTSTPNRQFLHIQILICFS